MLCNNDIALEPISFIGGNAETLLFDICDSKGRAYDLTNHTCNFYLSGYSTRPQAPIVSKIGELVGDTQKNQFTVAIESAETRNLSGKYIYQISISYDGKTVYEAGQGYCTIINNINRGGL